MTMTMTMTMAITVATNDAFRHKGRQMTNDKINASK